MKREPLHVHAYPAADVERGIPERAARSRRTTRTTNDGTRKNATHPRVRRAR